MRRVDCNCNECKTLRKYTPRSTPAFQKCDKCERSKEYNIISFPLWDTTNPKWCDECLVCPSCTQPYSTDMAYIWPIGIGFYCLNCYKKCKCCGKTKNDYDPVCPSCINTTQSQKEHIIDGNMCMICTEDFYDDTPRFRVCTNRPKDHCVCSLDCAYKLKTYADKEYIDDRGIIKKKGCPICSFQLNPEWPIW